MSASEPDRTHAADDKSYERFLRYNNVVVPLSGIPFIIVNWLMSHDEFDQIPFAIQWVLVVLVFVGALFMLWIFVRPRWRKFWVMPARMRWWGPFAVAAPTFVIALIVTCAFADISTFLYLHGIAKTSDGRLLSNPLNDSATYCVWNFLHSIPSLELPQALGWEEPPLRYTDQVSRLLLLVYKIVFIGPVIATIVLIWRDVRRTAKHNQ
jgi:hypothetical protein